MEKTVVCFKLEGDPLEYKLCYDFNFIVDAETELGLDLLTPTLRGRMSGRELRGLLYALLKTAFPKVLPAEAGELMTKDRNVVLGAVAAVLSGGAKSVAEEALEAIAGVLEEGAAEEPPVAPAKSLAEISRVVEGWQQRVSVPLGV